MNTPNILKALSVVLMMLLLFSCERNQPPTCTFIKPVDGFIATRGDIISISVNADDAEGVVSDVRLFINGSGLSALEFPYKFELNTDDFSSGLYNLKVTARDNEGLEGGDEIEITINATNSTVTTSGATSITYNSASVGGSVSDNGGGEIIETGVYWDTVTSPETAGIKVPMEGGMGDFSGPMGDLPHGKVIHYKAYAVNSAGLALGQELYFTTHTIPTVLTVSIVSSDDSSAVIQGNVSDDGGEVLTETGVYLSMEPVAEVTGTRKPTEHEGGVGVFNTTLHDLSPFTTYYVKAFAVNAAGEALGEELNFTTTGTATVKTLPVISVKYKSAVAGGEVSYDGGHEVTETGIYWGSNPDPVNTGSKLPISSGLGQFSVSLIDLIPGTTYYLKAYGINSAGESVGEELTFNLAEIETGTFTDPRDQVLYGSVKIGEQVWMSENLRATQFNDGSEIPHLSDSNAWSNNSGPAYCWYDNDSQWEEWGALYNWYAVNTEKLCPSGWHVPSDQEWMQLEIFLGMDESVVDQKGFRGTIEGGMLKTTTNWDSPNSGATNEVRFSGLPAGRRGIEGKFVYKNFTAYFWASAPSLDDVANRRILSANNPAISRDFAYINSGFSVRCLKDQ